MSLSRTMSRLGRLRKAMVSPAEQAAVPDRLSDLPSLADNPGQLRGRYFVPANLSSPAALVVVLHGCTQDAASYDHGSGWSRLADRQGFALLFPEQRRSNNLRWMFAERTCLTSERRQAVSPTAFFKPAPPTSSASTSGGRSFTPSCEAIHG